MLFFQGVLFFLPKFIWSFLEDGRIKELLGRTTQHDLDEKTIWKEVDRSIEVFMENSLHNNTYFYFYICANLLNVANVAGQIYLVNNFLLNKFWEYGINEIFGNRDTRIFEVCYFTSIT